jgi:guanyl-specific ribonuclease Sa
MENARNPRRDVPLGTIAWSPTGESRWTATGGEMAPIGPLGGTGTRLAVVCVLLSAAAASCTSSASVTSSLPSPTTPASPERVTPNPTGPPVYPTTVIPKGCRSGTVAISRLPADTQNSAVCIKEGARLRLTLDGRGLNGWVPLQVTPESAATVVYATESADILVAVVSPTGTAPFCLSTSTRSTESQPVSSWQLCVTIWH